MSAEKLLACPHCGDAEGLATIEELIGTARATFYENDVEWEGSTDVDWDSSMIVGLCCDCGWTYRGADWREVLHPGGGAEA
jgi:hypothetical protein